MHNTCIKHGRNIKTLYIGSILNLLKRKGLKFYQTRSNAIILYNILPAYCIPKAIVMGTGETIYEKIYASPRRPPLKIFGCRNWVPKLLKVVKTPNKPNQRPKIQLLEHGNLWRVSNHLVRLLKKSTNVSYLAAKAPMKEQGDLFIIVYQCLLNV